MTDEEGPAPPPRRVVQDTAERTRRVRWERDIADEVARLAARMEELSAARGGDLPDNLVETVAELREDVDRLVAAERRAPDPFHWDDITDEGDRARREHDLGRWWAEVVRVWHPRATEEVLPCWYEHLEARQIVTAAWLAWLGAYRVRGRKHGDPAYWIRVNLPAMVAEVRAAIGSAAEGCDEHPETDV